MELWKTCTKIDYLDDMQNCFELKVCVSKKYDFCTTKVQNY